MRESGIERLKPQRRSDLGQPRRSIQAKVDRAEELKRQQPRRSDQVINQILKSEFGSGLASSTLYRHLSIRGATRKRLGIVQEKVRCRWTRDLPNALWMGDFSHGPIVLYQGKPCQTHLSAWIDSHSRYIVDARYYLRENLDILVDSLLRAWATDIVNRISVRYQLRALAKDQTRQYIDYQIGHHGGDPKIFDEGVKDQIHEFTGGNPRGINNAAIACLLHATSKRSLRIDEATFRQASQELHWN